MTPKIICGDRTLFPSLTHSSYLNHAAVSPISTPVAQAIQEIMQDYMKNGVSAFVRWMEQRERLREKLSRFVGCSSSEIAFIPNTSSGVIQVAQNLNWNTGDRIALFKGEFPTNITPWQQSARHNSLNLCWFNAHDFTSHGSGLSQLEDELKKGIRLVAVSAVQFQTGLKMPIEQIGILCQNYNTLLFVDGIQAMGSTPIDLSHIDFLSCGAHKWLMGVEGTGFLYSKISKQKQISKVSSSWLSHDDSFSFLFDGPNLLRYDRPIRDNISSIEGGAYNAIGLAALEASIDILSTLGVNEIHQHINQYLNQLEPKLVNLGFTSNRDPVQRSGILSLKPPETVKGETLVPLLEQRGISVSYPDGNIRIAPHWPNSLDEIDFVVNGIKEVLE